MSAPTHVVIPRARLGDALLSLVVAHNLVRAGHGVLAIAPELATLRTWFPDLSIAVSPEDVADGALAGARTVVHQSPETLPLYVPRAGQELLVLGDDALLDRRRPRIDGYVAICRERLGIGAPVRANGMTPPQGSGESAARGRVLVHPGAREAHKAWPLSRFLALADELARAGHAPLWLSPPGDRQALERLTDGRFEVVERERLDDLAALLVGAALFIGNDSGVSHLASNVGTPTVTIFARPRIARHWRPAWAPAEVVLPRVRLPGASLQRRTWYRFVPVPDVARACARILGR